MSIRCWLFGCDWEVCKEQTTQWRSTIFCRRCGDTITTKWRSLKDYEFWVETNAKVEPE